jgi:hypothetical protein
MEVQELQKLRENKPKQPTARQRDKLTAKI